MKLMILTLSLPLLGSGLSPSLGSIALRQAQEVDLYSSPLNLSNPNAPSATAIYLDNDPEFAFANPNVGFLLPIPRLLGALGC